MICSKCGVDFIPTKSAIKYSHFTCKPCKNKHQREWRKHGKKRKIKKQVSRKKQRSIHSFVQSAVLNKLITKDPCWICGNTKSEAHHEDYKQPLDVIWLCRLHHKQRHTEIQKEYSNEEEHN